jgi:hypothetical protein
VAWRPDHFLSGVTYMPAEVGPWLWHEFSAERTARDLQRIGNAGLRVVRVPLAWDAFVPTPRQVDRRRLRDLETLLGIAAANDLQVVPVLFAQSFGDCVLLPRYAVARGERRRGVRVITDGIIEPGVPRDVWEGPLMLEVEVMWLEQTLRAFANHPAILAWDLGNDPATTCRPVRIAHVEAWAKLMGERVRATQDPCWMTLGAADVLTARGMRLSVIAPHVDALGMLVHPQSLRLDGAALDPLRVAFVARLAQRLAAPGLDGTPPPLVMHTAIAAEPVTRWAAADMPEVAVVEEMAPVAPQDAVRHTGGLLERLPDDGAVGALAAQWCDLGPRPTAAPPYDRRPWLAQCGIASPTGDLKPHGEVWSSVARRDVDAGRPAPWPSGAFDAAQWYDNLPDASNDLFARFRTDFGVAGE